jgi:hypothetical protein
MPTDPGRSKKQQRKLKGVPRKSTRRKMGDKRDKYAAYRTRVGRPNGPGQPGNKKGKGRLGGPSSAHRLPASHCA